MSPLAAGACRRHADRAASGLCAHCGRGFCKECLTPHAGRLACAECLAKLAAPAKAARPRRAWGAWAAALVGVLLLWTLYTAMGLVLARLPSSTHALAQKVAP